MKNDTWHIEIIRWFKRNPRRGLTAGEFAKQTGCTKLSTRICELETLGYKFVRIWEQSESGAKYIRYFLIKNKKDKK